MGVRRRPSARCGSSAREAGLGQRVAGGRVAHDADGVAAPRLLAGQVAHMAEQPADRRAQAVQDAVGARRAGARRRGRSEPALVDVDRVAGLDNVVRWYIHLLYDAVDGGG